jgi:vancomycin resistance protein YoaR
MTRGQPAEQVGDAGKQPTSRVYRPPVSRGRQQAPSPPPARHAWLRARTLLIFVAGALALASLSVAGAHWLPGVVPSAGPLAVGPVATPASVNTTSAAAAAPPSAPTPESTPVVQSPSSHLAALTGSGNAADVTLDVTFGAAHETLHRADLAPLVATDGGQPHLNAAALQSLSKRLGEDWNQPMVNARFNWNGGDLTPIRDSQEGRTLDQAGAATAIGEALTAGQPSVTVPGSIVPPQVSSENPKSLGITTNLDRGGTSFAGSIPEKAANIRLAAQRLNGVVVPPGGTFSFNQEVGPTTLDAGFQWGFGIEASAEGARTVPSVAGGICQVATTLFQRAFWSGFPLVERHWHLYWIPAYTSRGMVGLDATVDADSGLDLRWSNPTDGYILVQSATDDSNVYFGLYGADRSWKVKVDNPSISHRVAADPAPVAEAEPTLPWGRILPVETARDGFDVAISRTVTREDGQPRALTVQSSYEPSRTVTLVGTKNKPANADVDAVLARIAPPTRAPAVAVASPAPVETNAPVAGTGPLSAESPPSPSPTVAAQATAAQPSTATVVPASGGGATPTAVASRPPTPAAPPATSAPAAVTVTAPPATPPPPPATAAPPTATPRPGQSAATAQPAASPARR